MIPTNLKVGDTFIDGNKYKVTALCELGYISERIEVLDNDAPVVEPKKEEVKEEVVSNKLDSFNSYTKTEINRLSVLELEAVCDKLGLERSTGVAMKKAIIDHLGL